MVLGCILSWLWGAWWWRVSVRCHRVPLNDPKGCTFSPHLRHMTHYGLWQGSQLSLCWESHVFATSFWSFQKFGGIDFYRLIKKKHKKNWFMWVRGSEFLDRVIQWQWRCLGSLNLPLTLKDVWQLWSSFMRKKLKVKGVVRLRRLV